MLNNYDYQASLNIIMGYFVRYDLFKIHMETYRVSFNLMQPNIELFKENIKGIEVFADVFADNEAKIFIKDKFKQVGEKFITDIEQLSSIKNENSVDFFIAEQCNNYVHNNELLFFISGGFCIASSINAFTFLDEFNKKIEVFRHDNAQILSFYTKYSEVSESMLLDTTIIGNITSAEVFKEAL